jgi:hypothetical protein
LFIDNRVAPPGQIISSGILSQGFVRCRGLRPGLFSRLPPGGISYLATEAGISAPERVQVILYFLAAFRLGSIYLHVGKGALLPDCGIVFLAV